MGAKERRGVNQRTALYRLYDANDVLIYVGITKNIGQRWHQHLKTKRWWRQVGRREVEWLDSRPDALLAERLTVLAVLRESRVPMPEDETDKCRQRAITFAARVGWSKFQIATELGITPDVVLSLIISGRRALSE